MNSMKIPAFKRDPLQTACYSFYSWPYYEGEALMIGFNPSQ